MLLLFGRCMLVMYRLYGLLVSSLCVLVRLVVVLMCSFMWLSVSISSLWMLCLLLMMRVLWVLFMGVKDK